MNVQEALEIADNVVVEFINPAEQEALMALATAYRELKDQRESIFRQVKFSILSDGYYVITSDIDRREGYIKLSTPTNANQRY